MAYSSDFTDYVIEQLRSFERVTSRRMFGGVGLYADGLFFALISDDELYFKVDDSNRVDFEQRGCKPFAPYPDEPQRTMGYYNVPADLLDDSDELSRWARKSLAVALVAAQIKARKARPSKLTEKKLIKKKSGKKKLTKKKTVKKQSS